MVDVRRLLIVIPAFNEAACVGDVVREVRGELPAADVLVVDDGSTDDTSTIAAAAGAIVATLPFNLGVGGAMRVGYRYARNHNYDVAVQIDADGQHDPRYVPKLIDLLDECDLVIGARFAGEGSYRMRGPRRWAIAMLAVVLSWVTRTRLTDPTSGYRAANRRAIAMFAGWYPAEYLGDTVETLVYAARRGCRIGQVPVAMRRRMAGIPSHSPARATVYLCRAFAVLTLALIRR